jgi:hypothetical protein
MSGSTTMEGYLSKKGHALPIMSVSLASHLVQQNPNNVPSIFSCYRQRRYCVLMGTMLAYYTNADECARKLTPRNVLEVIGVRDLSESSSGMLSPSKKATSFEIQYLGGTTYECRADSREDKNQWLAALQHALDEPNRIVQDEIEDAQRHLQSEADKEDRAMALASEAVEKAQRLANEAATLDAAIKNGKQTREELAARLQHAKIVLSETEKKTQQTKSALEKARARAHDEAMMVGNEDDEETKGEEDDGEVVSVVSTSTDAAQAIATRVAHLAAQLEVDHTAEATQTQEIATIEAAIVETDRQIQEFQTRATVCATEGRKLRDAAAANLVSAHSAKQVSRMRVTSWTASSSHLDPLAEGYLLVKHPMKPSMHRRYYVLYGNTLCWYKDVDDYNQHVETPSGVVHVAAVAEWTGKVGGMKTFPHAFAVTTVEGKTLYCSAPVKQSAVTWDTALHIGLTMPALSPHRAMQAKMRRDSFDLLSSTLQAPSPGMMQRRASLAHVTSTESPDATSQRQVKPPAPIAVGDAAKESAAASPQLVASETCIVVEGYLVKKSSLFPTMKKKYCVLDQLQLGIFDSHEQYDASRAASSQHGDHEQVLVCGVSDWDGHGTLLQYHHGFQIHTVNHHMIQCSAANENEKAKWITGIHEALLKYKDQLSSPTRREEQLLQETRSAILATVETSSGTATLLSAAESLRAKIQQLYMEHYPAKAHDVPMLMDKYAGRESALVAHLDRIYGTELAQDREVHELVQTLESAAQEARRGRRRLSSGVNSGLKEFGRMTGVLEWTPMDQRAQRASSPASSSFSVLSVDRLVRYTSEATYLAEPFNSVEAIRLLAISDVPAESSTTFCVTYCRIDTDGKPPPSGPSSPHSPKQQTTSVMQLNALTEEQRTLWMANIRSGLGIVAAHATSPTEALTAQGEAEPLQADKDELRRKLIDYYRRHNPRRIGEIDTLLHYFAGREKLLLVDLDATYGSSISTDPEFLSLLPPSTERAEPTSPRSSDDALRYESYLWVKHTAVGGGFQKCYCVLKNTQWSCFENSRDAHAAFGNDQKATSPRSTSVATPPRPPLLSDVVVNLNYLNAKLHSMRVFNMEGQTQGAILLRADVDPLFQEWTRALRKAADMQQQLSAPVEAVEDDMPPWWRGLHDKLVVFYQQHHPGKEGDVANLLRSFEGREQDLLIEIDRIHHTQLADDPEFASLLPAPEPVDEISAVEPSHETSSILMEGYLVKRGHLVPSMRKRYCVLVKNVLTYFLTQEDSRNSDTSQPLGSFRVEIVSDWHGKTAMQTYEFGMELETHDGKTFFCAAFSSEEKTQWIRAFHHGIAISRAEAAASVPDSTPGDAGAETEEDRLKRDQLRERLVTYYQEHNPRKLVDLDLLLACYKGRELAMLEAMDATYGSQLLLDESMLRLLPPLNAHTQALRQLEYDGPLERAAGGNSDAAWKHIQRVYVSQKGLTLTFYASREGFKAGAAALTSAADRAVTVLAAKPVDTACRFAVETTEHIWMYFQAPNVLEKAHWLQLLQAALDAVLAKTILEEERLYLAQHEKDASSPRRSVLMKGVLMVRMDFAQSLEEYRQQLQNLSGSPTAATSPKSPRSPPSESCPLTECYIVIENHNELSLYANNDRSRLIATVTALSTRAWKATGGVAPLSSDSSAAERFPFQILTQEQVVLSCGAATDLERAKWIQQIRRGAQQASAVEMLKAQFEEENEPAGDEQKPADRRTSIVDEATGERRGYLFYQLGASSSSAATHDEKEGFILLRSRASMNIYADESAYLRGDPALSTFRVVEISTQVTGDSSNIVQSPGGHFRKLFNAIGGSSPKASTKRFLFQLHVVDERQSFDAKEPNRLVSFFPATADEQNQWIRSIQSGINMLKGEQLLLDEKAVLAIEAAHQSDPLNEADSEETFLFATSAIEGTLVMCQPSEPPVTAFAVLRHTRLLCFASREVAAACAQGTTEPQALLDMEIGSFADWTASRGFQLIPSSTGNTVQTKPRFFSATSDDEKHRWLHAVQHELEFALAEQYLDEETKEFARLAAAHVAAATGGTQPVAGQVGDVPPPLRLEGYVRVRHQFVGSMWRERFAVVMNTSLWLFKDGGDACADDWQVRAVERHELIAAEEWIPPTTSAAISIGTQFRHGLRLENQDGASLELTFALQQDRDVWLTSIVGCLERSMATQGDDSNRFISRDAALAFVPGAAMEGYLKVREKQQRSSSRLFKLQAAKWKTQYAVLIGTQWLLYETQQQALALHGHSHPMDTGEEQKEEGEDVLPDVVLEVLVAEPWRSGKKDTDDEELETHGFVVVGRKTSVFGGATQRSPSQQPDAQAAVGDMMECKAHTSLERKRWLNAMEDQLLNEHREQEMVSKALDQQKGKAVAQQTVKAKIQTLHADARRQSLVVREMLASMATEATTSEEEDDEDEEYEDDEEEDPVHGPLAIRSRSLGRVRSPENSPMYRRDLQEHCAGRMFFGDDPYGYDALGSPKRSPSHPWWSWQSVFACCFDRPPLAVSTTVAAASIAPLKNPKYVYEFYHEDAPSTIDDW